MNTFDRKTVVITGGASGIGAATATRFAQQGAQVVIGDVNAEAGQQLAQQLGGLFVATDVSQSAQVDGLVAAAVKEYGALDVMVNNAFRSEANPVEKFSDEQWRTSMAVTLDGVFYGCRAALRAMKQGGSIVNIASISGLGADYGIASYNTAKAGVINLTRTVAVEAGARGIRANAICPGIINTPPIQLLWQIAPALEQPARERIPLGRFGNAKDVANCVLFLCSPEAAYIHGAALVVDGGLTASSGIPKLLPDM